MSDSESESSESNEEKKDITIVFNNLEKKIAIPEDYKGLVKGFLESFKQDKGKEKDFIFHVKKKQIKEDVTYSDFLKMNKIYAKDSKNENANEDDNQEEVEKKPINDLELSHFSNEVLLQKVSSEVENNSLPKQENTNEETTNSFKEEDKKNEDNNTSDRKSENKITVLEKESDDKKDDNLEAQEKKSSDKKSLENKQFMSNINPASIGKNSLDAKSLDKTSEDIEE
jgi:hypothetical protein